MKLSEVDCVEFIAEGATRLTPSDVCRLVAEMPDLRHGFRRLRESSPEAERQLWFLSKVVERVWKDAYPNMPYGAALEAAFAVAYFERDADLIPDSLGRIGMLDDAMVIQTVIARNAPAYAAFRTATKLDWADFTMCHGASRPFAR